MRVSTLALAATIIAGSAYQAPAATLTVHTSKEGQVFLSMEGKIVPGDVRRLRETINTAYALGRPVKAIRLNSIGGDAETSAGLADTIHSAQIAVVVPKGAICASGCFLVFAAGTKKFASHDALIGMHGASELNGKETAGSRSVTLQLARGLHAEFNVPYDIIGQMVVTPPSQMFWLTPDNLRAMGTTMTGKPTQSKTQ